MTREGSRRIDRTPIAALVLAMCGAGAMLVGEARAQAPAPAPEVLVADAAAAYGSIRFERPEADRAVRNLTEALRQDPGNRQARELLAAIQRRRQEQERQREQQGQQALDRQRRQGQNQPRPDQQAADSSGHPPDQRQATRPDQRQAARAGQQGQRPNELSPDEAIRLLDALEQQDRASRQYPRRREDLPPGPRW